MPLLRAKRQRQRVWEHSGSVEAIGSILAGNTCEYVFDGSWVVNDDGLT